MARKPPAPVSQLRVVTAPVDTSVSTTKPAGVDDPVAAIVLDRISKKKAHPEYRAFEGLFGVPKVQLAPSNAIGRNVYRAQFNVWDLINDSVDGTGGYTDGSYLIPHELEFDPAQLSGLSRTFLERMEIARYDNFAKIICDGPWNSILSMKDMIQRDAGAHQRLEDFWDNTDGNGTDMVDFLDYSASQARRFGTGWIFLDRAAIGNTLTEDRAAQPWAYSVQTRNVIWWEFDSAGALLAVAYRDPLPEEEYKQVGDSPEDYKIPLRVWTRSSWSRWIPTGEGGYSLDSSGPNELGDVPCVMLYDECPGIGRAFGKANMVGAARMALDVYNRDSELRQIERRCGFPMLSVMVDDIASAKEVAVGTGGVVVSDGKTPPGWLEPNLHSIAALASERKEAKDAAFVMSEMTGLLGHTQPMRTTSGFHSEVELDKSERRISRFAASIETAENAIARLFLKIIGEPDTDYSVTYPRKFGLVNLDSVVARTRDMLALGLGRQDFFETLRDYYSARYPRKTAVEIEALANAAADARVAAPPLAAVQIPGQPLEPKPVPAADQLPAEAATARQRVASRLTGKAGVAA